MALIWESWRRDGNGQSRIDSLRSDTRGFDDELMQSWVLRQRSNQECVLITRSRTDKQSPWEKIVWTRPGYTDPCI